MRKEKYLVVLLVIMLSIPILPIIAAEPEAPWVMTNKKYYHPGETVKITGLATVDGPVIITLFADAEEYDDEVTANAEGKYTFNYILSDEPEIGLWKIEAEDDEGEVAETSFIVLKIGSEEVAAELLEIAQDAWDSTEDIREDVLPPAVQMNFDAAEKALEEAQRFLDEDKYQASIEASIRTQKHITNALKILAREKPEIDEDDILESKIDRAQKLLDSLKKVYEKVKENLSSEVKKEIDDAIVDAQEYINEAKDLLDENLEDAEDALIAAKEEMENIKEQLQEYAKSKKSQKALNFIDNAIERVDKLKAAIEELRERLGDEATDSAINKLGQIRSALESLREDISNGATVEEIHEQMEEIRELLDGLRDTLVGGSLKQMNKFWAWLQLMKGMRGIWLNKGFKVDELDAKIKMGEDNLGRTIHELAAGRKFDGKFPEIINNFKGMFTQRHGS